MKPEVTARIILKKSKIESIERFHPWIFSGAIKNIEGKPEDGDLVEVYDHHDKFLGIGFYAPQTIAVRLLSLTPVDDVEKLIEEKIFNAFLLRKRLNLFSPQNNAFRLVYAEGDLLPGLIADYYNGLLMIEYHARGMEKLEKILINAFLKLRDNLPMHHMVTYIKSHPAEKLNKQVVWGNGHLDPVINFQENGYTFLLPWHDGQKTGFFLDQRENRKLLERISHGRDVLNMFCYTGSFSIYALKGGARSVVSVDSSDKALHLYKQTLEINGLPEQPAVEADAMDYLTELEKNTFDLIILDPPAFAKHIQNRHHALIGYKRINAAALSKIRKGGYLLTFSCSQAISFTQFQGAVTSAAIQAKRHVRVLAHLSQAHCHAYSIFHPEGSYLKGLWLYVE